MATGKPFGLVPGHTSSIRRIEAGMLSYHADMDINTNPYELGLDRLVDIEMEANFVGKAALNRIAKEGVGRMQVGLEIGGEPLPGPNTEFWPVTLAGKHVGKVTSATHSPRLDANIALAMIGAELTAVGTQVAIDTPSGSRVAKVVPKPFYDPSKKLPNTA